MRCLGMDCIARGEFARISVVDQWTINVEGSGFVADAIRLATAVSAVTKSGSLLRVSVNVRSSLVNGAPSCHVTPGLSFQVTSMVPSGFTCQVPRSTEGT